MGEGDGQTCPDLETELKEGAKQWESVESDTESLAQEKLHSRPGHRDHDEHAHTENDCTGSLQQEEGDDDYEEENLVYDSLDESSDLRVQRECQTEHLNRQIFEKERSGLFTDDSSAQSTDSRNDLKKHDNSADSSQTSFEEVSKENVAEEVEIKGGYRYIVVTSPADVETPQVGAENANQPYHLHPGDCQSSCASPHDDQASQDNSDENGNKSPVTSGEAHAADNQTDKQKEPPYPGGRAAQETGPSLVIIPQGSNKKQLTQTRHIVDRNKKTLGRTLPKRGSYVRKHVLKKMPDDSTEEQESVEDATPTQNQKGNAASEQKTQDIQVAKTKEAKLKEDHNPSSEQQQRPLAQAKRGSSLPRPAAATQRKPPKATSSKSLPTTINVNISLDTSSQLLPLLQLQQRDQDALLGLASLHGHPHLSPAPEMSAEYQQRTNPGKLTHIFPEGMNMQLYHENKESHREQTLRFNSLPWPLSQVKDLQTELFPLSLPESPSTGASSQSHSYPVLPPIGKLLVADAKLGFGQSLNTANLSDNSETESYLLRMEKEKELKAKEAIKQQKADSNPRGFRPDHNAIEYKAEKMRRQRMYSNVIRNMNKHLSRIPFLPAKDPEGSDKKAPRMKALEYAKTIAKPRVRSQSKQSQEQQSEGISKFAPHLQGLDVSELTKMELLRKRHEEEKRAVACFRKYTF